MVEGGGGGGGGAALQHHASLLRFSSVDLGMGGLQRHDSSQSRGRRRSSTRGPNWDRLF